MMDLFTFRTERKREREGERERERSERVSARTSDASLGMMLQRIQNT